MRRSALVLAAHGSRLEPSANAQLEAYKHGLLSLEQFDEIAIALHRGEPGYGTVLDQLSADTVIVVPLMTSEGHFSEIVLPRELAQNDRYRRVRVRCTSPVGIHPGIVPLACRRVCAGLARNRLDPRTTTLVIVGHGTRRHRHSRIATVELSIALDGTRLCAEVLPAFLDDDPQVGTIPARAAQPCLFLVPFLIGDGRHAVHDIPNRLGLDTPETQRPPYIGQVDGKLIVCDSALGTDPGIIEIVADLARGALHEVTENTA